MVALLGVIALGTLAAGVLSVMTRFVSTIASVIVRLIVVLLLAA